MQQLLKYLELGIKGTSVFLGASYAFGFLVWNIYLQSLGFYPNLFQGRFILTGTLFILIALGILGCFASIKSLFEWICIKCGGKDIVIFKNKEYSFFFRSYIVIVISIIYLFVFSFFMFSQMPGYLGGGKPRLVAIMGDSSEISYLSNFGTGSSYEFQTNIICSPYEDSDQIIVVLSDRILSLNKDLYKGLVSLPNKDENEYVSECNAAIISNMIKWRSLNIKK